MWAWQEPPQQLLPLLLPLCTIPTPFPMLCSLPVNEAPAQHKLCDIFTSSATKKQLGRMWCPHLPSHLLQQSSLQTSRIVRRVLPCPSEQYFTSSLSLFSKRECLSPLSFLLQRSKQLSSSHFPHPSPRMGTTSLYLPPKITLHRAKHLSPATITSCLSKIVEESNAHNEETPPRSPAPSCQRAGRGVRSLQTFVFPVSRPRVVKHSSAHTSCWGGKHRTDGSVPLAALKSKFTAGYSTCTRGTRMGTSPPRKGFPSL